MYSLKSSNSLLERRYSTPDTIHDVTKTPAITPAWSPLADRFSLGGTSSNRILAKLPGEDQTRIFQHLELVSLSCREELRSVENGDCYIHFPQTVVISQLSMLNDGSTAEVALIGNEGLVGLSFIFSIHVPERQMCVAKAGSALRMRAKDFKKEFESGGALQHLLLNYMGSYVEQISQRAVCNSQHQIEKRLACWLLMMHDRAGNDLLPLTQEQIACRLGTRRSSVTLAAMALQEQHTISYFRGRIHILDRRGLEMAACECYRTLSQASNTKGI